MIDLKDFEATPHNLNIAGVSMIQLTQEDMNELLRRNAGREDINKLADADALTGKEAHAAQKMMERIKKKLPHEQDD